jgi:hypothetical protein
MAWGSYNDLVPDRPTILIDNNGLSSPMLADRVQGKTIYLADTVFYELFAAGEWEKSISHALAPLAPFAGHVQSTVNMSELLRREMQTGEPTKSVIGDPVISGRLPDLLRACRDNPAGAIRYFRENQPTAPAERAERMTHVPVGREVALHLIEWAKAQFDGPALNRLRTEPEVMGRVFTLDEVRPVAIKLTAILKEQAGFDTSRFDPERMTATSCCHMRYLLADLCLGVRRAVQTSFPDATDDQMHGEQSDRDIVVVATYADEFFTVDKRAVWLDRALRSCIRELFPAR